MALDSSRDSFLMYLPSSINPYGCYQILLTHSIILMENEICQIFFRPSHFRNLFFGFTDFLWVLLSSSHIGTMGHDFREDFRDQTSSDKKVVLY